MGRRVFQDNLSPIGGWTKQSHLIQHANTSTQTPLPNPGARGPPLAHALVNSGQETSSQAGAKGITPALQVSRLTALRRASRRCGQFHLIQICCCSLLLPVPKHYSKPKLKLHFWINNESRKINHICPGNEPKTQAATPRNL